MLLIRSVKKPKYIRRKSYYTLVDLLEHIILFPFAVLAATSLYLVEHFAAFLVVAIPFAVIALISVSGNLDLAIAFMFQHGKSAISIGLFLISFVTLFVGSSKTYTRNKK